MRKQFHVSENNRKPKFGCSKGSFVLAPDFDEPLNDFNE